MSNIYSHVSKINFDSEYTEFSRAHDRCSALQPSNEEYNAALQKFTSLNLPIKQLIVNELTNDTLRAKLGNILDYTSCLPIYLVNPIKVLDYVIY